MFENGSRPMGPICLHTHPKCLFVFSPDVVPITQTQPKRGPKGLEKLAHICKMIISLSLGACDD